MIFEKIRERLQELYEQTYYNSVNGNRDEGIRNNAFHNAIDIINQVEAEYNQTVTNVDRIRHMTDEELAQFLVNFKNTFGEEYEGVMSCLEWLRKEVEG